MKPVDEEEVETTILSYKRKTFLDVDNMSMFLIQKNLLFIYLIFETREFHSKKFKKFYQYLKKEKKRCFV